MKRHLLFQSSCEATGLRNKNQYLRNKGGHPVSILLRGNGVAQPKMAVAAAVASSKFQSSCEATGLRNGNSGLRMKNAKTGFQSSCEATGLRNVAFEDALAISGF